MIGSEAHLIPSEDRVGDRAVEERTWVEERRPEVADRPVVDRPVVEDRPAEEDRPVAEDSKLAEVAELALEEREQEPHQLFLSFHQSSTSSESDVHDAIRQG